MSILIKNADYIWTGKEKLRDSSILIENNEIKYIGNETNSDCIINAEGMIVTPGFINTHHHMTQSLFRNVDYMQNQPIEKWVYNVSKLSKNLTYEAVYFSSLINMAELLLSGCTTTVDFFYLYPNNRNDLADYTIKAAQNIGIRFNLIRSSVTNSNLFPSFVCQKEDDIMVDTESLVIEYHNPDKFSMMQIGTGPCSIFTSSKSEFEKSRDLAGKHNLNMFTHLSETEWENKYCIEMFGKRPLEYLESLKWLGKNVVLAHCVNLNEKEIKKLAETKTGVSHCPISNARGSGIASVTEMIENNVRIGIGVDGSAGNDSSNILEELRWARTLQGARGRNYLDAYKVLEIGSKGGADLLNRDDIGTIEIGKAADIVIFDPRCEIGMAGSHDPVSSLISSQAIPARHVFVNGRHVVKDYELLTVNLNEIIKNQKRLSKEVLR